MKRLDLTDRDINILNMVYFYDGVGINLIHKAFFPWYENAAQRVKKLCDYGYLRGYPVKANHYIGHGILFYLLGIKGKKYLSARLDLKPLREASSKPDFIEHHLATCDFRWAIESGCNQLGIGLDEWITERELYRKKTNPTPDGDFTLSWQGQRHHFRLETDRSTVMPQRMREKLAAYYKEGSLDPVLWIVPDLKRANDIEKWACEVAEAKHAEPRMHWIALHGQDPFSPIWRVAGGPKGVGLL